MTVAEFEVLAAQSDTRLELIDGEVLEKSMPKFIHQWIQRQVYESLRELISSGHLAFIELQFRPAPEFNLLQADLAVVSRERCSQALSSGYVEGAPEMVIEVVSPSNDIIGGNRRRKLCFANGCLEFWLVDPENRTVEVATPDGLRREFTEADQISSPFFASGNLPVLKIFA
jgi:Uma2 family endonuclease